MMVSERMGLLQKDVWTGYSRFLDRNNTKFSSLSGKVRAVLFRILGERSHLRCVSDQSTYLGMAAAVLLFLEVKGAAWREQLSLAE